MRRGRVGPSLSRARTARQSRPRTRERARAQQTHVSSRFARASHRAFRAIRVPRAATHRVGSFPRRGSDTAVMRVASFPGGEAALAFGRVPSTPTARARFPIVRGASPVDVAASAANDEPVSPSSRVEAKTHLRSGESLAFDMLFDTTEAADLEDVEEMDEAHGDSEDDAHDPVSVYVRYATRGPARTPDAFPGPCAGHTTASSRSNEPTRVFSSVIGLSASNERALSEKSKKYPSFPVRPFFSSVCDSSRRSYRCKRTIAVRDTARSRSRSVSINSFSTGFRQQLRKRARSN